MDINFQPQALSKINIICLLLKNIVFLYHNILYENHNVKGTRSILMKTRPWTRTPYYNFAFNIDDCIQDKSFRLAFRMLR